MECQFTWIECAAIVFKNKVYSMAVPARHCDVIQFIQDETNVWGVGSRGQGFLTNHGDFVTREEAEVIARACGQMVGPIIGGVLTSEDLW